MSINNKFLISPIVQEKYLLWEMATHTAEVAELLGHKLGPVGQVEQTSAKRA